MPASVTVAVRIRPLNEHELSVPEPRRAWRRVDDAIERLGVPNGRNSLPQTFPFDKVFDESATNNDVYRRLAEPLVTELFKGRDSTIMAYGQTNSGKTHTMLGAPNDAGLAQCAVEQIIATKHQFPDREFDIRASYVEVYNERVRDLLRAGSPELKVRDCANGSLAVDAMQEKIYSYSDAIRVLHIGKRRRVAGITTMNAHSSRSHALLSLQVSSSGNDDILRTATLHFVDLAGSERAAVGGRAAEGNHINRSLLALGRIVSRLANENPTNYLPYRDSKLTRLLRPAFSSGGHITLLGAITPAITFADETLSTLKFAACLKNIPLITPQRNSAINYRAEYMRVSREVDVLRDRLASMERELAAVRAAKTLTAPASPTSSCQSAGSVSTITSISTSLQSTFALLPHDDENDIDSVNEADEHHDGSDYDNSRNYVNDDVTTFDDNDDVGDGSGEKDDEVRKPTFEGNQYNVLHKQLQIAEARAAKASKENARLRHHLRTVVAELRGFRSIKNTMITSRNINSSFDASNEGYSESEMFQYEDRSSGISFAFDSKSYVMRDRNALASSATAGRIGVIQRGQPDIDGADIAFGMSGVLTKRQRRARSKFELAVRLGNNNSDLRFYGTSSGNGLSQVNSLLFKFLPNCINFIRGIFHFQK